MNGKNKKISKGILLLLEVTLLIVLSSFLFSNVFADIGENATVTTLLDVGNVFPEIFNVSIQGGQASVSLTPANTTSVYCEALVVDYNGDSDIVSVNATLFDTTNSQLIDVDDNNTHYTNSSCAINTSFGTWNSIPDDAYNAVANCSFQVQYYANSGNWNCSATSSDIYGWTDNENDSITVNDLLALGIPNSIHYGTVNATYVSDENTTNVTNYGNVEINLSLSGYAQTVGDGYAMNCSLGAVGFIDINYEKYNLTELNTAPLTLTEFEQKYENLTASPIIQEYNLASRQNDTVNEAINSTYWRMYVPLGVAGTCQGNIIFGATQAPGI